MDLSIKELCDMWHQRRCIKLTSVVYGVNQTVRKHSEDKTGLESG